jgi:hypothetical protein
MESVRRPASPFPYFLFFFLIWSLNGTLPDLSLSEKMKSVRRPAGAFP